MSNQVFCDVSGKGKVAQLTAARRGLMSHYVVTAREPALQARAVPKNSIDGWTMRGIHPGEENLKAVARPSCGAAPLVERAENGAALRPQFVEEESCRQSRGVNRSSSGSREVAGRDKQQVWIAGTDAHGVPAQDLR